MTAVCRENTTEQGLNGASTNPPLDTNQRISGVSAEKRLVPRLALSKAEAADALGCSIDFLEAHVLADLCVVRRGRRVFIPVAELERWLVRESARTLGGRA
jgi:hypothetical protein